MGDFSRVIETIRTNPGRKYLMADGDTLFQRMFYLRGFENLMVDLAERCAEAAVLRDRIVEFMLKRIEIWLGYGVDGLFFRDDWGTQQELMIRPALWREFFKPSYRRLFDAVHAGGKHVFFHSDGVIDAIIPDLIEIGVDAMNAQIPCMDAAELARDFGTGSVSWRAPIGSAGCPSGRRRRSRRTALRWRTPSVEGMGATSAAARSAGTSPWPTRRPCCGPSRGTPIRDRDGRLVASIGKTSGAGGKHISCPVWYSRSLLGRARWLVPYDPGRVPFGQAAVAVAGAADQHGAEDGEAFR